MHIPERLCGHANILICIDMSEASLANKCVALITPHTHILRFEIVERPGDVDGRDVLCEGLSEEVVYRGAPAFNNTTQKYIQKFRARVSSRNKATTHIHIYICMYVYVCC